MTELMEKIAKEAFVDEIQKIDGSSYKTTPDTMSKSNRMSLGKSYDTKNQLGSAVYYLLNKIFLKEQESK